ncbi:major facilitator superfamily domain-containing protein [Cokeromyces recurvatus]|uniref:major facilitator superfamily domain-containing protein n=1 Tax=Cokeromyces recurvatus TaxID=90255 RepID=UPI0022202C7B|nr:major facilitator superfamily domain-containing protein [Cokeromyces recurvatus]KAI7904333.1 major facilitator superfamily domain-containing protein [Cokeromyces recurvatus]
MITSLILVSWVITWEKSVTNAESSYVTSYFQANDINGIGYTVVTILQTALQPLFSKLSDMVGRAFAYTISVIFFMIAFIVMACANNYATLIGGKIIFAVGYSGIYILGPILIADSIGIVNRSLALAFYNFPMLITVFVGAAAGQGFINAGLWRWGYGHIAIVMFVCSLPLILPLYNIQRKVKKAGLVEEKQTTETIAFNQKSFFQKLMCICKEIDLVGAILLMAGLFLLLLPVILATSWGGWRSGKVLGCLIPGIVVIILFVFWEWKVSKPILPIVKWESPNPVLGTLVMACTWMIHTLMDGTYASTYLRVTRRLDAQIATYINEGFQCAHAICPIFVGILVIKTRRWRPFIWIGTGLNVVSCGLMILARKSTQPVSFFVIVQVLRGMSLSFLNYPVLVGMQGSIPSKDAASVTTFFEVGVSISGSIGSAIAAGIWTGVLPTYFKRYVPGKYDYSAIVKSISVALKLPRDQWEGVVKAYDSAMHIFCIVALIISCVALILSLFLKGFVFDPTDELCQIEEIEKHYVENVENNEEDNNIQEVIGDNHATTTLSNKQFS